MPRERTAAVLLAMFIPIAVIGCSNSDSSVEGGEVVENLLSSRGLGFVSSTVVNAAPRGTVISQDPLAGVTFASGANVSVLISTGQVIAQIPSVVGLCSADAQTAIGNAGFSVSLKFMSASSRIVNRVESQTPGGGIFDQQGSNVELLVSLNTRGQGEPSQRAPHDAASLVLIPPRRIPLIDPGCLRRRESGRMTRCVS